MKRLFFLKALVSPVVLCIALFLSSVLCAEDQFPPGELISINAAFSLPRENLQSIVKNGKGFSAGYSFRNVFIEDFSLGCNLGFLYFDGKKDYVDSFMTLPLLFNAGYTFSLNFAFDLQWFASFGLSYNMLNYSETEVDSKTGEYSSHSRLEMLVNSGFLLGYKFSESIIINTGVSYNIIPESSGASGFISIIAGVSIPVDFFESGSNRANEK